MKIDFGKREWKNNMKKIPTIEILNIIDSEERTLKESYKKFPMKIKITFEDIKNRILDLGLGLK